METIKNALGMGHKDDAATGHTGSTHTGTHDTTTTTGHVNPHASTGSTTHTGVSDKTSNLTSRFGMNDNVAKPQDEGTTVVGGGFPSVHTGDHYIPTNQPGQGKEIYGRGTTGEHFGERTGPIPQTVPAGQAHDAHKGSEGQSTNAIGGHRGNVDPSAGGTTGREHLPPPPSSAATGGATGGTGRSDHSVGIPAKGVTGGQDFGGATDRGLGIPAKGPPTGGTGAHHSTTTTPSTTGHSQGIAPPLAKGDGATTGTARDVNVGSGTGHTGSTHHPSGITAGHTSSGVTGTHASSGLTGAHTSSGVTGTHGSSGHGIAAAAASRGTGTDTTGTTGSGLPGSTHTGTGPTTRSSTQGTGSTLNTAKQTFEAEKRDLEFDINGRFKE